MRCTSDAIACGKAIPMERKFPITGSLRRKLFICLVIDEIRKILSYAQAGVLVSSEVCAGTKRYLFIVPVNCDVMLTRHLSAA
jgi:hypothetical protein